VLDGLGQNPGIGSNGGVIGYNGDQQQVGRCSAKSLMGGGDELAREFG